MQTMQNFFTFFTFVMLKIMLLYHLSYVIYNHKVVIITCKMQEKLLFNFFKIVFLKQFL